MSVPATLDLYTSGMSIVEHNAWRRCKHVLNRTRVYACILMNFQQRSSALIRITGQPQIYYNNGYRSLCNDE